MIKYLSIDEIERQATEVLEEVLGKEGLRKKPIPLDAIAHYFGIMIEYAPLGDDVSGLLLVEKGKATIAVNNTHSLVRRRFTIAHEIGHYLLHGNQSVLFIDKEYIAARDTLSSSGEDRAEIQANLFAAALLMPRPLLEAEIKRRALDLGDDDALPTLAKEFQVSVQAMAYRLFNLGIL